MIELDTSVKGKDFPPNPEEKEGYQLEFCETFQGSELDTTKWLPYYLPQWSSRQKTEARYDLQGGLQLHIEADQAPWCPQYDGDIRVSALQTGCLSGPVGSSAGQHRFRDGMVVNEAQPAAQLYTPQFGYFEVRLKAVALAGYMCTLYMLGFEERGEESSGIDICEIRGEHINPSSSVIGYGVRKNNDPAITEEYFEDTLNIDASSFHIYAAEWTPNQIDFFIDNQKTRTIKQSAKYPMQFMLGIYELPSALTAEARNAPFPKTMLVDYVRGYKVAANGS